MPSQKHYIVDQKHINITETFFLLQGNQSIFLSIYNTINSRGVTVFTTDHLTK